MRLDSHMDDKIPNDNVSPLGIENSWSIVPLLYFFKFADNLLFYCSLVWSLLFLVVTCAISGSLIGYPVQ